MLFFVTNAVYAARFNYDFKAGNLYYVIKSLPDRTVVVSEGDASDGIYDIPEKVVYQGLDFDVVGIQALAFMSTYVKQLTIPSSVEYIDDAAFYSTEQPMESLVIKDSPRILDVTWMHSVNNVDLGQFSRTKLKYLYLGRNLKYVPYSEYYRYYNPFYGVYTFEEIEVGKYVTDISHFMDLDLCTSLKEIKLHCETPPEISDQIFSNLQYINVKVTVPQGCISNYKAVAPWKNFLNLSEEAPSTFAVSVDYDANAGSVFVNKQLAEGILHFPLNTDLNFTFLPEKGYELKSVIINGVERVNQVENNRLSLNDVLGEINMVVTFLPVSQAVSLITEGGFYSFDVPHGESFRVRIDAEADWTLAAIYLNGENAGYLLSGNVLEIAKVNKDYRLAVIFEKKNTAIDNTAANRKPLISIESGQIVPLNSSVQMRVYDLSGSLLYQGTASYEPIKSGIYIVETNGIVYKLSL